MLSAFKARKLQRLFDSYTITRKMVCYFLDIVLCSWRILTVFLDAGSSVRRPSASGECTVAWRRCKYCRSIRYLYCTSFAYNSSPSDSLHTLKFRGAVKWNAPVLFNLSCCFWPLKNSVFVIAKLILHSFLLFSSLPLLLLLWWSVVVCLLLSCDVQSMTTLREHLPLHSSRQINNYSEN